MRVATNSFADGLAGQLGGLSYRQNQLQTQVSTGQRIKLAEDDPTAVARVLDAQAEARSVNQYKTNISRQQDVATANYTAIKSLKTLSDRAGEITTLAGGVKSQQDMNTYADEINQMIQQGVQILNTKNNGNYTFGGTQTDQPPYAAVVNSSGDVTGVTYQGNSSTNEVEISEGSTFSAQIVGSNTSGTGQRGLITDSTSGADFFSHLISLRDNLRAGNLTAVTTTDMTQLQHDEDNFLYHVGLNGAMQTRLDSANAGMKDRTQTLNTQVSNDAGTDMASTIVRLNQAQTAYQAALQSSGKILNMSLMDYLR